MEQDVRLGTSLTGGQETLGEDKNFRTMKASVESYV